MGMKEVLAVASLAVSIGANIPYVLEIIQGKVRPERISWLLWTMLGVTYYLTAIFEDGATLFTFGELVGPVIIFVLALKYGVGGRSKLDTYSLAVALVAFGLLFVVEASLPSLLLALLIDGIGLMLTVRKLLIDPASESKWFWGMAAIASALAIASLHTETLLFPGYVLLTSLFIFAKASSGKVANIAKIEKL